MKTHLESVTTEFTPKQKRAFKRYYQRALREIKDLAHRHKIKSTRFCEVAAFNFACLSVWDGSDTEVILRARGRREVKLSPA